MEITHETLEKMLKISMDKLKFSLGLDYHSSDYSVQLVDHLKNDFILTKGEVVPIKVLTERFTEAFDRDAIGVLRNPKLNYQFRQTLEKCLRLVPRMFNVLGSPAVADALVFNDETGKFKKLSAEQLEQRGYERKAEKGITFNTDYRVTAIHWETGTIIREFGSSAENATQKARSKILLLLQDPTSYNREAGFTRIEPHEDIIYDIVLECKVLNSEEVTQLIRKLEEEYLTS